MVLSTALQAFCSQGFDPSHPSGCFARGCKFLLEIAKHKVGRTKAIKRAANNSLRWLLSQALARSVHLSFPLLSLVQSRADQASRSPPWKRVEIQSNANWIIQIFVVAPFTSNDSQQLIAEIYYVQCAIYFFFFFSLNSLSFVNTDNRGHQRHGEDAWWGGGEGSRCCEKRRGKARGAKATGGGEKGQICKNGGRERKHPTGHQR